MRRNLVRTLILIVALGLAGCITIAKKAYENRSTEQQVTDTKVAARILKYLTDQSTTLPLDVKGQVWEGRVMLTEVVDNSSLRNQIEGFVREDKRVRQLYNPIKIVTKKIS